MEIMNVKLTDIKKIHVGDMTYDYITDRNGVDWLSINRLFRNVDVRANRFKQCCKNLTDNALDQHVACVCMHRNDGVCIKTFMFVKCEHVVQYVLDFDVSFLRGLKYYEDYMYVLKSFCERFDRVYARTKKMIDDVDVKTSEPLTELSVEDTPQVSSIADIQITTESISDDQVQTINARELHTHLEVGKDFSTWIKDRIKKYNFVKDSDYVLTFTKIGERKNVKVTDYHITLDMAKHLAMLERSDKGKEAREYFIECERKLIHQNVMEAPKTYSETLKIAYELAKKNESMVLQIEEDKPKVKLANAIINHTETEPLSVVAKIVSNSLNIKIGEISLLALLSEIDMITRKRPMAKQKGKWEPMQWTIKRGFLTLEASIVVNKHGEDTFTTKICATGKGIDYICKNLGESNITLDI